GPLPPVKGTRYLLGLDIGLKHDATAAVIAHAEPALDDDGHAAARVVLDRIETWHGTRATTVRLADVETWVEQASLAYNRAAVLCDPWQGVALAQRLRGRGLRIEEINFTPQSITRMASSVLLLLRNGLLHLPDDP